MLQKLAIIHFSLSYFDKKNKIIKINTKIVESNQPSMLVIIIVKIDALVSFLLHFPLIYFIRKY